MLGIRFIKVEPTDYVLAYKGGQIVREGAGLAFFYYAPTTSLVLIPVGSVDAPFIFEEVTADYQQVTIQGQLTYRITEPKKLAHLMNFTLATAGRGYASEDPQKLPRRLINQAQVMTRASLKSLTLREALGQSATLEAAMRDGMRGADEIGALGVEVLGLSILAIKPTPETARALEADAREKILGMADEAVYARRNMAVEQERAIKENELNTEIAVENKKRQIKETQLEAEKAVQQKRREIRELEMAAEIALEAKNQELVELAGTNARARADAEAYGLSAMMKSFGESDPKTLEALASVGMDSGQLVARAFKALAERSNKIGQLNVSPDLLRELLDKQEKD